MSTIKLKYNTSEMSNMNKHKIIVKKCIMIAQKFAILKEKALKNLQTNILHFGRNFKIPNPPIFIKKQTHSWFDLFEYEEPNLFQTPLNITYDEIENDGYKTSQYKLLFTDIQAKIIEKFFDMYILMYNCTVKYIKTCNYNGTNIGTLTEVKKILYPDKQRIIKLSQIMGNENKMVYASSHMLDYAINDSLNAFWSCISNLKNGHIKHFRIRYLKRNKPNKIIKLEKSAFGEKTILGNSLGVVKCSDEKLNYKESIETVAIVTKRNNSYFLLLKHKQQPKMTMKTNLISIDPGVRTFITGYHNHGLIEIGKNMSEMIKKMLLEIDRINKSKGCFNKVKGIITKTKIVSEKKIKKMVQKRYDRIKNMIKDMHWKIANYLVSQYGNIIIGNMSTKKIVEGKLTGMTKRIAGMMALFQFTTILKYKCVSNGNNFKKQNEMYTSKCCGKCANKKDNLGGNTVYKCKKCGLEVGRDINSSRDIMIAALDK